MSESPILIVPYMWIGDFVRCHTVVKLLKQRFPSVPIDILTTSMVAPLLDYMPGVRKGIIADLPRKRLALSQHRALARWNAPSHRLRRRRPLRPDQRSVLRRAPAPAHGRPLRHARLG